MMMPLFQLLLFTGIVPFVLSAYRKYYLIQDNKTWDGAKAFCQATHTNLAIIQSSDDMIQFEKEAQKYDFNSEAWIGLYNDINSWRWSFNNEPPSYTDWVSGEPNNYSGHEECCAIDDPGWYAVSCNAMWPVLCYDDLLEKSLDRYIHIPQQMNWYEAQAYCRTHHTDLAIIRDSTESQTVLSILYTTYFLWIGLSRESWKWIDKTNMSTIQWRSGQPDNSKGNENCGFVSNGQVSDDECSVTRPFFCYSDITERKQTIKVKIQSKQDVNDPAVKAAILEKIKEKLTEHGMAENTTVKWVEQPGGVVFHKEERNEAKENTTEQSCDLYL